jgi:hypothetical protein
MRQIDDQWRGDLNESNYYQVVKNLLNKYHFTNEDNNSITHYRNNLMRSSFTAKCSNVCFDLKTLNYNNCIESCMGKYMSTLSKFDNIETTFNEKYNTYEAAGKYYFQS